MAVKLPRVPEAVPWRNGMVLEPEHFQQADSRGATLSHLAGLVADPWPWGFVSVGVDETALASGRLRVDCEGIFPTGQPFRQRQLTRALPEGKNGDRVVCHIATEEDGAMVLSFGDDAPAEAALPVARLVFQSGVWSQLSDWSPPAYLIGPEHPLRTDMAHQLGALAALGAGFMATLRLPGAEQRPAARMLGQVAAALAQGVGVIEALLAAPAVSPGRLGIEALRLALGVRAAAGVFEQLEEAWDPADQRGAMRRLLYAAETTASGIGLPFRASLFRPGDEDTLRVGGMPPDTLLLAIEAARPADLIAARTWLEGAALAAPDRIGEALTRRVAGCTRRPVERDPRLGVSSGPLLALYHVEDDMSWRAGSPELALAARTPPPANTSFSVFIPEGLAGDTPSSGTAMQPPKARSGRLSSADWAGSSGSGGRSPL